MKNQTPYLWALIIAFLTVSCGGVKNVSYDPKPIVLDSVATPEPPCLTEADSTDGNIDAAKKRMRGRKPKQIKSYTAVVIHREQWVQRKGSDEKAIAFLKPAFDRIGQRRLDNYNIEETFDYIISKPGEFPLNGTSSTFQSILRQKYPRLRAHKIIFVGWGGNGGIAVQGGAGIPGNNYASVVISDASVLPVGGYQENDINHELWHLDGAPHSHSYIHTVDGVSFQALENYGQYYFPSIAGQLRGDDIKNPKIGGKYARISATSYEASKFLPYSLDLHPLHVPLVMDKIYSGVYDALNTAENLRYENGAITYDDQFHGAETYQVRIGTFKNGNTSWGNWQEFPDAEKAVNIPLTKTYNSSGTTGFRYESAELPSFDYVKAVVPSGVTWLCSWGIPDSGAQPFPADGIFKFTGKNNYLQIRPKTATALKPISVTGYKSGATQSRVLPVKLAPGMYYLEIQNVRGGYPVKSNQITVK